MIFRSGPQSQYARELQIQSFRRYNIIKRRAFCSIPSCRHYSLHQSAGLSIIWHYLAATSLFWARKGFLCRRMLFTQTQLAQLKQRRHLAFQSIFSIQISKMNCNFSRTPPPPFSIDSGIWSIWKWKEGGEREREREREGDQNRSLKTNWSIKTGSLRVSILGFGNRGSHCRFDWRLIGWRMWRWNVFWC